MSSGDMLLSSEAGGVPSPRALTIAAARGPEGWHWGIATTCRVVQATLEDQATSRAPYCRHLASKLLPQGHDDCSAQSRLCLPAEPINDFVTDDVQHASSYVQGSSVNSIQV